MKKYRWEFYIEVEAENEEEAMERVREHIMDSYRDPNWPGEYGNLIEV